MTTYIEYIQSKCIISSHSLSYTYLVFKYKYVWEGKVGSDCLGAAYSYSQNKNENLIISMNKHGPFCNLTEFCDLNFSMNNKTQTHFPPQIYTIWYNENHGYFPYHSISLLITLYENGNMFLLLRAN